MRHRKFYLLWVWLMVSTISYALGVPNLQDGRWPVQRTQPISILDLYQSPLDLQRPENLKYQVEYNDTLNLYFIGNKMGNTWISAPIMMTPKEYMTWTEIQQRSAYFRKKNEEVYQAKGKDKFDFSDMHFDLGPAEKIFGPGGIRVKTQGTVWHQQKKRR